MTDRSFTEEKVNKVLMNECTDFNCNKDFYSFKCSVHPLLQFSDECLKGISKLEKDFYANFNNLFCKESYTFYLIRCVSKSFFKDGTGDPLLAAIFIKDQGIGNILIMNVRGNRFNVLFYNAAGIYFLRKHIMFFLSSSKSTLNVFQNFILCALQNNFYFRYFKSSGYFM